MGEERHKVVKEEVDKLLHANIIREVRYSTWLASISKYQEELNLAIAHKHKVADEYA